MPRISLLIVLIFATRLLFSQNDVIQSELKKADGLTKEGSYDEALVHINNALEEEPLHLTSLEKKVNVMILAGREKDILKELKSLIDIYPQQPEYYYLQSLIYLYRQKSQKAIESLDNAEYYQMPQEYMGKIYMNRGTAYYYYGDFVAAEQDFSEAVKVNPRNAAAYHSWGMMKYEEQLFDEAISYFKKAIQYQDNNPIAYYNLGLAYFKIDDKKNACFNFSRACNLNHKNACKTRILECSE